MDISIERRSLIASTELGKSLDEDHWLAFECAVDEAGGRYWKTLVCSEGNLPRVVITQRRKVKLARTFESAASAYLEHYPDAAFIEIPLLDGEIAPRSHPFKKRAG